MLVLLGIFTLVALGAIIILGVDRTSDLRFAFQRDVAGFNSAEAGVHVGAVGVQNTLLNFNLPTNCSTAGTSFAINSRTVTYKLSVPTAPPWNGTAGSCSETPVNITEPAGSAFASLNAFKYVYNLTSSAANALGFTEATINNQFEAHLIPVFQFAAFYTTDMEMDPGPPMTINGRMHTNRDLYIDTDNCGSAPSYGLDVLGQITIVGSGLPGTVPLNRGQKDDLTYNNGNVYISLDGTASNMQVLGTDAPGSTSCSMTNTRQIGTAEINTFNTLGPRVVTNLRNISAPAQSGLMCVPWITSCGSTGGSYWQNANLRLALDSTTTAAIDGSTCPGSTTAPCLYPVRVLNADGSVNASATTQLKAFMQAYPGAITYTDTPASPGASNKWDCSQYSNCESQAYNVGSSYVVPFPQSGQLGCTANRNPRDQITATNYCNDYRYGGFFNWREDKPILMLNIDWMALEEYNDRNGNIFFNPSTTTNGGLVIFLTVKDTNSTEGSKADNYGVRIFDAGRARRNFTDPGVTFATDQAMYLTGNFNCPQPNYGGSISSPAPCGDAVWPPTGSSTYQKPTSIAADTVNVLSCAWIQAAACSTFSMNADQWAGVGAYRPVDENSTTCGGSPGSGGCPASQTIVNAAFYSAVDQSWCPSNSNGTNCDVGNPSQPYYNGGLNNYPRFHEDWHTTPTNFWYQGSLVASGLPNHTCFEYTAQLVAVADDPAYTCTAHTLQGFWSVQRFVPPNRRWFYDVSFNNLNYLPPLTPRFVYLNLLFFTQVFQ